ncbi:MAG TPA: phosphoribosylaminoimidazolesuccinocarboxamide synthase, partial [Gemmatimonadales bacterium]|nr:phosphoribosylaminoimidazolesuccinocarboxamide synthase [Gemmatimonadales bacterium]
MTAVTTSRLPLPLWRRGKVREVYEADGDRLLLVASDRVSAFDVVMAEPVPRKGQVLTQLSAFWFRTLGHLGPHHFLTADADEIVAAVPALGAHRDLIAGRATLVRRTVPVAFECVVRGYLSGSAWKEYRETGTLAGERLPAGLTESDAFPEPLFSPATKAETGHDENVTFDVLRRALGAGQAEALRDRSLALFSA